LKLLIEAVNGCTRLFCLESRPGSFEREPKIIPRGDPAWEGTVEVKKKSSSLEVEHDAGRPSSCLQYAVTTQHGEAERMEGADPNVLSLFMLEAAEHGDEVLGCGSREGEHKYLTGFRASLEHPRDAPQKRKRLPGARPGESANGWGARRRKFTSSPV